MKFIFFQDPNPNPDWTDPWNSRSRGTESAPIWETYWTAVQWLRAILKGQR